MSHASLKIEIMTTE